jgi:hypothetical protein
MAMVSLNCGECGEPEAVRFSAGVTAGAVQCGVCGASVSVSDAYMQAPWCRVCGAEVCDCECGLPPLRSGPTLTAGQIIGWLSRFPADMPVTVGTPGGGGWLNIDGLTDPYADGVDAAEYSVIVMTADDFDPRQA